MFIHGPRTRERTVMPLSERTDRGFGFIDFWAAGSSDRIQTDLLCRPLISGR